MTQPPTDREIVRALIDLDNEAAENLIDYWMHELTDWLNQHPVSSYAPKKEENNGKLN